MHILHSNAARAACAAQAALAIHQGPAQDVSTRLQPQVAMCSSVLRPARHPPVASTSLSLLQAQLSTASSCIMNISSAW